VNFLKLILNIHLRNFIQLVERSDALQTLYYTNNIVTENSFLAIKPHYHNKYQTHLTLALKT